MVKKGNFNKALLGRFSKSIDIGIQISYSRLNSTLSVKHLPDDSDKLAGAMPKCIVERPVFSSLGIVISLEGCVVSNSIPNCINERIV